MNVIDTDAHAGQIRAKFVSDLRGSEQEDHPLDARAVPGAGFLVTIDGPAGVGKTAVAALTGTRLAEHGFCVAVTRQPSDSDMGKLARASTYDLYGLPLSFLMAADRYRHQDHVITPALKAGQVVVCDRYVTTALVLDQLDGAEPEFIWSIYRYQSRTGPGCPPRRRTCGTGSLCPATAPARR